MYESHSVSHVFGKHYKHSKLTNFKHFFVYSNLKFLQLSIEFPVFFIKERDVTKAKTGTDILDPFQHINHAGLLLLLWTVVC